VTGRLAATVEGSGRDVLLVHGQPGDSADWAGVRERLSDRFRVIAPDRPGYGATGGRALGIAANAEAMVALLDELDSSDAIVAGHSWGAGVALAMALRHRHRVRRLVLVCPVTPGDRLGLVDRVLATPRVGVAATRAGFALAGRALATARVQERVTRVLPGLDRDRLEPIARAWRDGPVWRSFYREQRALFDELPKLRDGVYELDVPITVVVASHDRITDPDAGRAFAAAAGAQLVEVPRAGHMLPMQAPDEVADAIASDEDA
jgi:pimeloyl-ACP methyl ester carboxylesterase